MATGDGLTPTPPSVPNADGVTKLICVGSQLIFQNEAGDVNTIDLASKIPMDVVTSLSFDYATKTLTFVNEEGAIDAVDLSPCFPSSSYNSTLHEVILDGISYPINVSELQIDYATKELVYTNAAGTQMRIDLSPCIPDVPDMPEFGYDPSTHTVSFGGASWQLNCADLSYDATSCSLNYVDEKGSLSTIPLPQDTHLFDPNACTLTIISPRGVPLVVPLGAPAGQVSLTAIDECTLEFSYKGNTSRVSLANSLVGCSYDAATNTLTFVRCDGTQKTMALAKAALVCTELDDGTQVVSFDDGCGNTKMFNIPGVQVAIDNDSFTLVGSVLTFTSDNDTTFTFDICDVVSNNCNATFAGINADGSWSFVDNAGNTHNGPAFPEVPVKAACCLGADGSRIELIPDADGKVEFPFHRTNVISPDASVSVVWNSVIGQYEITVPPSTADTNTHTTVTSNDGSVEVVAGTNADGAPSFDLTVEHPEFPEIPVVPTYVDKAGNAIPDGAELLQASSFPAAATPPPSTARLLAFDANGQCIAYLPPEGVAFNDKNGQALPDGARLLQITDFPASGISIPSGAQILALDANGNCVTYLPPEPGDGGGNPITYNDKDGSPLVGGESLLQISDFDDAAAALPPTAKILAVDVNGDCQLFDPPAGVSIPTYVGKNGVAIANGATLMQLSDFPDASVVLPATAKLLALDANGDCQLYDPPPGFVDTNDWLQPSQSLIGGTDVYGVAYDAGDNILTTPDGLVICVPEKIDLSDIPVVVDLLGKDGEPLPAGATVLQPSDFPPADEPLPTDAQIFAVTADGDCVTYDAPKPLDSEATFAQSDELWSNLTNEQFDGLEKDEPVENGIRWNPGAYLSLPTPRRAVDTVFGRDVIADPFLCNNPYFEGVHCQFMWWELEPFIGQYRWDYLDEVFAGAENCGTKKRRVIVMVLPASFSQFAGPAQGPVLAVPEDADPADWVRWQPNNGSWVAHLREWGSGLSSPLHTAWRNFWVAFAARYGSNELLEAVIPMGESVIPNSIEDVDPSYSDDEYAQERLDSADFVQSLLPCVQIKTSLNFLGNDGGQAGVDSRLQDIVDWMDAAPGRGLTWPDTFSRNFATSDMPLTQAQRIVPDNANRWGHVADSQNPSQSRYRSWTELHTAAQSPSFTPTQVDPSQKFPPSTDPDFSWRASHLSYRRSFLNDQAGIDTAALQAFIDTNPVNSYDSFPTQWAALGAVPKTGLDNSSLPPTTEGEGYLDLPSEVCITPPCLPYGVTSFTGQYVVDTGPITVELAPLSEFRIEMYIGGVLCNFVDIPVGASGILPPLQKTGFITNLPAEVETCQTVTIRVVCLSYDDTAPNSIDFGPSASHSLAVV